MDEDAVRQALAFDREWERAAHAAWLALMDVAVWGNLRSTAAPTVMRPARGALNYNSSRERWRRWKTAGRRCSMRKFETTASKRALAFGWGETLNRRFRTLFLQ